jgi:signal transduction histidine kinase
MAVIDMLRLRSRPQFRPRFRPQPGLQPGSRWRPVPVDALAALVLFAFCLTASAMAVRPSRHVLPSLGSVHPSVIALAAVSCSALLTSRRYPKAALTVTVGCGVLYAALGFELNPVLMSPVVVAICAVAVSTDRRTATISAVAAAGVLVSSAMGFAPGSWLEPQKLSIMAWSGMAAAFGDARAERTREEEARRRVAEDRIRIARELHDVVAHHIALINAQAGIAVHLADELPPLVREALEHIRDTSHEALQELKATVGLLRQSEGDAQDPPLEPAPGIAQLPELLASFARTGLDVQLEETGRVRALPPSVDLTAYRIVQESLTNVSKHAGVPTARVQLYFGDEQLAIRVEDDGRNAPMRPYTGSGHGLIGMRERAAVVGGALSAGRDPWGGFRVAADLPLRFSAAPTDQADQPDQPSRLGAVG